ncbi:MAG TPA: hypothetical protein VD861_15955 [Pyrinomonadaceae bacterium]|nr:hypothetical protein [Pyrinomonadaceae bacterium]
MSKRFFAALTLSLSGALLLLAGCGSTETTTNNSNQTGTNKTTTTTTGTPATTATPATTTTTPATTTTTASGDKIGVPECDDFIDKYEACITGKVPEAARAQWNSTLQQWRSSWKQLAANPQTRSSLASACKMAADQSRQSMQPYGCDF